MDTAVDTKALASAERADLAAFLRTLEPDEWERGSLCEGWRVRDVVAHLVQVDEMSLARIAGRFVRVRFSADRFNAMGVAERAGWPVDRLAETLEGQVELGRLSRVQKGVPALVDTLVHEQDIRRPLGRSRQIPTDRLRAVLGHPDRFTGAKKRVAGLRLVATDIDWTSGTGAEVRGPAEALIMATSGRAAALADLAGEGLSLLRERF